MDFIFSLLLNPYRKRKAQILANEAKLIKSPNVKPVQHLYLCRISFFICVNQWAPTERHTRNDTNKRGNRSNTVGKDRKRRNFTKNWRFVPLESLKLCLKTQSIIAQNCVQNDHFSHWINIFVYLKKLGNNFLSYGINSEVWIHNNKNPIKRSQNIISEFSDPETWPLVQSTRILQPNLTARDKLKVEMHISHHFNIPDCR